MDEFITRVSSKYTTVPSTLSNYIQHYREAEKEFKEFPYDQDVEDEFEKALNLLVQALVKHERNQVD